MCVYSTECSTRLLSDESRLFLREDRIGLVL